MTSDQERWIHLWVWSDTFGRWVATGWMHPDSGRQYARAEATIGDNGWMAGRRGHFETANGWFGSSETKWIEEPTLAVERAAVVATRI